jgi:hypothetical protein
MAEYFLIGAQSEGRVLIPATISHACALSGSLLALDAASLLVVLGVPIAVSPVGLALAHAIGIDRICAHQLAVLAAAVAEQVGGVACQLHVIVADNTIRVAVGQAVDAIV